MLKICQLSETITSQWARKTGQGRAGYSLWPLLLVMALMLGFAEVGWSVPARELRVCSDPNNLPFSNQQQEGFENKIADLLARELDATVNYTWWAQRRGFLRNTLLAGECDVVIGVPSNYDPILPTKPYYRSTYVFLSRKDAGLEIRSLDDPILRHIKIGVHVIGDDYANPPPVHALAMRGIINNIVGYSIFGDYREENPPARIIEGVTSGHVDVAIVWGPFAGYFARRQAVAMQMAPVPPLADLPFLPFVFNISMGTRKGDHALKRELEEVIDRRQADIQQILEEYGIPLVP